MAARPAGSVTGTGRFVAMDRDLASASNRGWFGNSRSPIGPEDRPAPRPREVERTKIFR